VDIVPEALDLDSENDAPNSKAPASALNGPPVNPILYVSVFVYVTVADCWSVHLSSLARHAESNGISSP
jgi:hypothetical protein